MGRASSMDGINRSPSLTPKALTPTNSYDSGASNNGRGSPNVGVASPSSGQELPVQVGKFLVSRHFNIFVVHVHVHVFKLLELHSEIRLSIVVPLYNTARLINLKVSIACVWTCVSRSPSIIQPG